MKLPFCLTLTILLAGVSVPTDTNAQAKKPRFSSKELERRFDELKKSSPKVQEAAENIPDTDKLKQAFNKALEGKLDEQLEADAKRLAEGIPSESDSARFNANEFMNRAREFAPDEIKRIEESEIARKLKAGAGDKPPEIPEEGRALANVTFTAVGGGALQLPDVTTVAWNGERTPIDGHGPAPGRTPYTFAEMEARRKKDIEEINITSTGGALFAENSEQAGRKITINHPGPIAIFQENVFVDHPEFKIDCDELTIFLRPDATNNEEEAPPAAANEAVADESLKRAVATGREVTVQRIVGEKLEIGKARRLVYDGDNGVVTLIGDAIVQRGGSNNLAGPEIVLPPNGEAYVNGGSTLRIERVRN
ncbi:MAG: LptA/OstA family protein [Verrucomicrobiota bacterium]